MTSGRIHAPESGRPTLDGTTHGIKTGSEHVYFPPLRAIGFVFFRGSRVIPKSAQVVIVGGGIIGCAAAYYLARRGVSVVVCEKGVVGGEQSSRNWGFVRQQGRDPAELPLSAESQRLWRGIGAEIGADVGYRECGTLYLADSPKRLAEYERWCGIAVRDYGLDTEILTPRQVAKRVPEYRGTVYGAMHTAGDGRAEPAIATTVIARAAGEAGASVIENCAARVVYFEAGRAAGVVTERGLIRADAVLCAGGAWSSYWLRNHGVRLPQLLVKASVLRTEPAKEAMDYAFKTAQFGIRRRNDGAYTVAGPGLVQHDIVPDSLRFFFPFLRALKAEFGATKVRFGKAFFEELLRKRHWDGEAATVFESIRVLDPSPDLGVLRTALDGVEQAFPVLRGLRVARRWAGVIDTTPDALPVISAAAVPGLYLATGFSGHGFGIGLGAGKVAAELVRNRPPTVDLQDFSLSRFG